MPGPYKEAARRLHEIAQSQQGLIKSEQASTVEGSVDVEGDFR